jgi:hypothetical protein
MIGDGSAELQRGLLKAADHKSHRPRRQWLTSACTCRFSGVFGAGSAATTGLMVLTAPLVAPQPLFDADRSLFRTVIGIWGHSFGFEQRARIKMQHAFSAETEAILSDGRVARISATEVFGGRLLDTIRYFSLQGRANTDVPSRYA